MKVITLTVFIHYIQSRRHAHSISPVISYIVSLLYLASIPQKHRTSVVSSPGRAVHITRKEKEYRGMLEYREGDESRLLKNLVVGMLNLFCRVACKCFSLFADFTLKRCNLLRSEASRRSSQLRSRAAGLHHLHVRTIRRQCE